MTAAVVFAPVAALTWDVDGSAWPYIAASAALELAYFALLAAAYERADLSFVYPIARGAAPVLVLVVVGRRARRERVGRRGGRRAGDRRRRAARARRRHAGPGAGSPSRSASRPASPATRWSTTRASATRPPCRYFEAVLLLTAPVYAAAVMVARGRGALRAALTWRAGAAGVAMFAAYALTLAALEIAEAAPVAALRETSVVMATAAAAIAAHEQVPPARLAGAVIVVAGIALIALA